MHSTELTYGLNAVRGGVSVTNNIEVKPKVSTTGWTLRTKRARRPCCASSRARWNERQ